MNTLEIGLDSMPKPIPILTSLPFQLGILSIGLYWLTASGSLLITADGPLPPVGSRISFFTLFIVFLVFVILLAVR
ncbi:MAG: hypothetical protein M0Z55_13415 [Peptococcaceae bacterium]|nr:hypothetical protein [Peptococcaceae bacterium]